MRQLLRVSTRPDESPETAAQLDPALQDTPGYSSALQMDPESDGVPNEITVRAAIEMGRTSFAPRSGEKGAPIFVYSIPEDKAGALYGTIDTPTVPGQPTKDADDILMFMDPRGGTVNELLMHPENKMSKREATYSGADVIRDEHGREVGGERNLEVRIPYEAMKHARIIASYFPDSDTIHWS